MLTKLRTLFSSRKPPAPSKDPADDAHASHHVALPEVNIVTAHVALTEFASDPPNTPVAPIDTNYIQKIESCRRFDSGTLDATWLRIPHLPKSSGEAMVNVIFNPDGFSLHLDRDSVCAGDDAGHHRFHLEVMGSESVEEIFSIIKKNYLPSIWGGNAVWAGVAGRPLAILAQQWAEGKFLVDPSMTIRDCARSYGHAIYFRYHAQASPEEVFDKYNCP